MEKIDWKDDFYVGIHQLDEEHKMIVNAANNVLAQKKDLINATFPPDYLSSFFHTVLEHFENEEKLMLEVSYPGYQDHLDKHGFYRNRIAQKLLNAVWGKEESYNELVAFLHDWLNDHILTEDKKLASFLKDKNIY